jgi:hypothetical protein
MQDTRIVGVETMDDAVDIIKSFLLNVIIAYAFSLVCYFLLKWFAGWSKDELSQTANNLLLIAIPIGFALFTTTGNNVVSKIIRTVGFFVIIVPTLLWHLELMKLVDGADWDNYCSHIEFVILPISWIVAVMTYIQIGYEIWGDWAKFSLAYVFVLTMIVHFFFISAGKGLLIFYLIAGCIGLAYLGIVRLKEGSAFEY